MLKLIFESYLIICTSYCTTEMICCGLGKINRYFSKKRKNKALSERIEKEYEILKNSSVEVKEEFNKIQRDEFRESALGCIKICNEFSEQCRKNR